LGQLKGAAQRGSSKGQLNPCKAIDLSLQIRSGTVTWPQKAIGPEVKSSGPIAFLRLLKVQCGLCQWNYRKVMISQLAGISKSD
jgi:hypothetical protein